MNYCENEKCREVKKVKFEFCCARVILTIFEVLFTLSVGLLAGAYLVDTIRNNIVAFIVLTVILFVLFIVSLIYRLCSCIRN